MKIDFIFNGDPDQIPSVGSQIKLSEYLFFRVEGYGESIEIDYPDSPTGKAYKLELVGCFVIPAGTPLSVAKSAVESILKSL